jgi:hypothetical protein
MAENKVTLGEIESLTQKLKLPVLRTQQALNSSVGTAYPLSTERA